MLNNSNSDDDGNIIIVIPRQTALELIKLVMAAALALFARLLS
jgi:hypothetical protein